jgi:hypothetical protein
LLLIACLNLSSLLGARAAAQRRQVAVRLALGQRAGAWHCNRWLRATPLLLVGGALGIGIAIWAVAAFVPLAPATLPRVENIHLSSVSHGFAGRADTHRAARECSPIRQAWGVDLMSATREDTRSTTGGRAQARARSILVATQIALALPLLVGAVLLSRSFVKLTEVNPGFRTDNTWTTLLAIPRSKYADDRQVSAFADRLLEQVANIPEVASADLSVACLSAALALSAGSSSTHPSPCARRSLPPIGDRSQPATFRRSAFPCSTAGSSMRETSTAPNPSGIVDERIAKTVWPERAPSANASDCLPWPAMDSHRRCRRPYPT